MDLDKEILISNRYRIVKKIAAGGMADIFLGEDLKLDRKVAIKILSRNYAGDRNFVARFKSEAQVLAKLKHPNIVDIYDWGKFDDSYFIVMEYIDGLSLKELIDKKGALDPQVSTRVVIQICEALDLAHKNNLIHRDIKPQNILITSEGEAKVTDFGIAKSLNTDITKTLNIVGTAQYISPEQARGGVLDHRTDIYSLGVVLYEMLTGDTPFRGDTSVDISLKHIGEKPIKPTSMIANTPQKLEKIVMVCLEKDPSRRYGDITSLKNDLINYLEGKPLTLGKNGKDFKRITSFSSWISKNPLSFTLGAFLMVFLTLFIIYSSLFYARKPVVIEEKKIPPIENMLVDSARETLSFFGMDMEIGGETYSDTVPENHIIKQEPRSSDSFPPDNTVKVIVSLGNENPGIIVPNILGLKIDEAEELLESIGLDIGQISKEFSDLNSADNIISQDPSFGVISEREDTVDVIISKGNEAIVIPNIIGLDYIYASDHLESLGLGIVTVKTPMTAEISEPGLVVSSVPQPGTSISQGSAVELWISTSETLNEVPDLIGLSIDQASQNLSRQGIGMEVKYVNTDYSFQHGEVLDQWPLPGYYIPTDSMVLLFIGE